MKKCAFCWFLLHAVYNNARFNKREYLKLVLKSNM